MSERKEKFTPGPWEVLVSDTWEDPDFGMVRNYNIVAPAGSPIVGPIADTPSRFKEFEVCDLPNARLIAAAPELYAICDEIREAFSYFSEWDLPIGFEERLDAALAKARGEA